MKRLSGLFLALAFCLSFFTRAGAQAANTIWMETSQPTFQAGETITITINAISSTPIQGFRFQLRYDPACLKPLTPTSLLSGLNYMAVPQTSGLVDGIFASTTAVNVNGPLASIQFQALSDCQTELNLEQANLAVLDASKVAVPLPGMTLGTSKLAFNTNGAPANTPQKSDSPTSVPSNPTAENPTPTAEAVSTPISENTNNPISSWILPVVILLGLVILAGIVIIIGLARQASRTKPAVTPTARPSKAPALFIKRGPQAGRVLPLVRFPCRIGSDPDNEICLNDVRVSPQHAEIFTDQYGFTVVDLGSPEGTYLNGRQVQGQQTRLKAGDVLRLGGVLLVFGSM